MGAARGVGGAQKLVRDVLVRVTCLRRDMAKTAQGRLTLDAASLKLSLAQLGEELPRNRGTENRQSFSFENAGEGWKPHSWGPRLLRSGVNFRPGSVIGNVELVDSAPKSKCRDTDVPNIVVPLFRPYAWNANPPLSSLASPRIPFCSS